MRHALLSHDPAHVAPAVSFLSDPVPQHVLSQTVPSLPPASSQSKSAFETKTAAINITPSPKQWYNIDEIKADALWLSKEVSLDEVEALRLVVLEWQYRPESRLREGFSDAEIASVREALGSEYVDRRLGSSTDGLARSDDTFDSEDGRRARILSLFLQQQVAILRVAKELWEASLVPETTPRSRVKDFRHVASKLYAAHETTQLFPDVVDASMGLIRTQLGYLERGRRWSLGDGQLTRVDEHAVTSSLMMIALAVEILLLRVRKSKTGCPSETLLAWLQLLASVDFFGSFQSDIIEQQIAIQRMQSTGALVTLSLLDPASTITALAADAASELSQRARKPTEYFLDADTVGEIHEILLQSANVGNIYAGPAVLAWALILNDILQLAATAKELREGHHVQRAIEGVATRDARTGRRLSGNAPFLQQSVFEDVKDKILLTSSPIDDPAKFLLDGALDRCRVFDYVVALPAQQDTFLPGSVLAAFELQILQETVAVALQPLGYTADLLASQLAILSAPSSDDTSALIYDPNGVFLENEFLVRGFFDVAAARFPYEALPFLRFCKSLAQADIFDEDGTPYVAYRLKNLTSFTQAASRGFASYSTIREDENANLVSLERSVSMFDSAPRTATSNSVQRADGGLDVIPAHTVGEVISESAPPVVRWQHQYSGLALLGAWLDLHCMGLLSGSISAFEAADDVVAEAIQVLTSLLSTTLAHAAAGGTEDEGHQQCAVVLDEASSRFETGTDVVTCVFDILEQELQTFRRRSGPSFKCSILNACLDFTKVLSKVRPHQVLRHLFQSSLLSLHGSTGLILGIVSAIEIPRQEFSFLERCAEVYKTVITLALQAWDDVNVPGRKDRSRVTRFAGGHSAKHLQETGLLAFSEVMFAAFQEIPNWTFRSHDQHIRLSGTLAEAFCTVLRLAFDLGEEYGSGTKTTMVYLASANMLATAFRQSDPEATPTKPILWLFADICTQKTLQPTLDEECSQNLHAVVTLAGLLIRHGQLQKEPMSSFDVHLFNATPLLVRLPLRLSSARAPCLQLLEDVMRKVDQDRPSSLLGLLGATSSIAFLNVLKHLEQSWTAGDRREIVWKLSSSILQHSQQWLAIVLLTGSTPNTSKKRKSKGPPSHSVRGKPFLQTAVDSLSNIDRLPQTAAIAMLGFVIQAHQNCPWATSDLHTRRDFFPALISYVDKFPADGGDEVKRARHYSIAALVTELSTIHLHHAKAGRELAAITPFTPLLRWLTAHAVDVSSYNSSLHANLRRNFAAKYSGLSVMDLKRTGLTDRHYGDGFYYDIEYANRLMAHDAHWSSDRSGRQSFAAEFRRANTNLSLVDAELTLLQSFRDFCTDHCAFFVRDREVQKAVAHVISHCLRANTRVYPSERIFEALFQTRADLSMVLISQLVETNAKGSDFASLLHAAWDSARFRNGSYDMAIAHNDLLYWRSVLSILLMAMHFHINRKLKPIAPGSIPGAAIVQIDPSNATFLEIATVVVADGFKSIVAALLDQKKIEAPADRAPADALVVGPKDLSLVLTIFQTLLRLQALPQFAAELSTRLCSSGVVPSCLVLYSWSHLLITSDTGHEPVYADLCLRYLVSLSSLAPAAEELAIEGVLSRILTSKVTQILQSVPGGVWHLDKRPRCALLYHTWATGILPLCLNLLHAVGGAIAGEVASFLNQFPNQLNRASSAFMARPLGNSEDSGLLTFTLASEAATLALISYILNCFRGAGASAAVDPTAIPPLAGYDEHRAALVDDIRDVIQQKDTIRQSTIVATDSRELKWQRSKDGDILDKKIVQQLRQALLCLPGDEEDDEKS